MSSTNRERSEDRVSWTFLELLLSKFGFHGNFIRLIMNNLKGAWFSVLVNGAPNGFFQARRGLKQGDPLSPYLFLLVVEALSRGLHRLFSSGRVGSLSLPQGALAISHLAFADDLILFARADRRSIHRLFDFLDLYERASGQQINKDKSSFVISKHSSHGHSRMIGAVSGIKEGRLPFKYLGCIVYKGRKKREYFQHLIDIVHKRLSGWMGKVLSPAGRLILIKHVLTAIPMHIMAVMEPPLAVLDELEGIFSRFLWGSNANGHRRVWRSWKKVAFPVQENGLGVRRLTDIVASFSCKLWWKWRTNTGVWAKYINSIKVKKSFFFPRLRKVDEFMRSKIRYLVRL